MIGMNLGIPAPNMGVQHMEGLGNLSYIQIVDNFLASHSCCVVSIVTLGEA